MPRDASITFIVGRRGSGKTTQAEHRLRSCGRLIVFAPIRSDFRRGYTQVKTLRGLLAHLQRNWQRGFRLAYRPPAAADLTVPLDRLARLVLQVQQPYADERETRQVTLAVDEANLGFPHHRDPTLKAFAFAVLQGRHYGVNIVGITQRPTQVDPILRDNADRWIVFPLGGDRALDSVLAAVGRRHADAIRRLTNHQFLEFADGEVRAGRNPPL